MPSPEALIAAADAADAQTPEDRVVAQRWAEQFHRSQQLDPQIAALRAFVDERRSTA